MSAAVAPIVAGANRRVEIAGTVLHERGLSWHFHNGTKRSWLPKKLARWHPQRGVMSLPYWFAKQKGLLP